VELKTVTEPQMRCQRDLVRPALASGLALTFSRDPGMLRVFSEL